MVLCLIYRSNIKTAINKTMRPTLSTRLMQSQCLMHTGVKMMKKKLKADDSDTLYLK